MKLLMQNLSLILLVLSFSTCGTKQSAVSKTTIEENIAKVKTIDAFYLTKCYWEDELFLVKEDKTENYLYSLQEIRAAYSDCYDRHNGLVEELKKN